MRVDIPLVVAVPNNWLSLFGSTKRLTSSKTNQPLLIKTMTMRLTILNYETGKVYQAILPKGIQEIIDNNHSGDWEDFLEATAGFCHVMHSHRCEYVAVFLFFQEHLVGCRSIY